MIDFIGVSLQDKGWIINEVQLKRKKTPAERVFFVIQNFIPDLLEEYNQIYAMLS